MTIRVSRAQVIGLFVVAFAVGCEEEKKKPSTVPTAAAAPTPEEKPPTPPPVEEKKPEPVLTPLEKCCGALQRGAFGMSPDRQSWAKGAAACRDAHTAKKELDAALKAKLKKEMGKVPLPDECG